MPALHTRSTPPTLSHRSVWTNPGPVPSSGMNPDIRLPPGRTVGEWKKECERQRRLHGIWRRAITVQYGPTIHVSTVDDGSYSFELLWQWSLDRKSNFKNPSFYSLLHALSPTPLPVTGDAVDSKSIVVTMHRLPEDAPETKVPPGRPLSSKALDVLGGVAETSRPKRPCGSYTWVEERLTPPVSPCLPPAKEKERWPEGSQPRSYCSLLTTGNLYEDGWSRRRKPATRTNTPTGASGETRLSPRSVWQVIPKG